MFSVDDDGDEKDDEEEVQPAPKKLKVRLRSHTPAFRPRFRFLAHTNMYDRIVSDKWCPF